MSSSFDPVPSDRLEVTKEAGAALTDFDYRVMASVLKMTHSLRWPKDAISYLAERIGLEGFQIPVSQLSGFNQFVAQVAPTVAAAESTASTAYTDLATVGPKISGMPGGAYLLLFGCNVLNSVASYRAHMSVDVNSAGAADADGAQWVGTTDVSVMKAVAVSLTAESNTVTAKYRSSNAASSALFGSRWLIALKYAQL